MQTKTPAHIKWLLVERATLAGSIERHQENLMRLLSELNTAKSRMECLDTTIKRFDERVNQRAAGTVKAFKQNYGKRGALKDFIKSLVHSRPDGVCTGEVGDGVIRQFALVFNSKAEYTAYMTTSLKGALSALKNAGFIENSSTSRGTGNRALWRSTNSHPTFADMLRDASLQSLSSPGVREYEDPRGHQMVDKRDCSVEGRPRAHG